MIVYGICYIIDVGKETWPPSAKGVFPLIQKSIGERATIDPQSFGESSTRRTVFDNPWKFSTCST